MKRRNWIAIGMLLVGGIIFLGQPSTIATNLRMFFVQATTPFVRLGDYIPTVKSRRDLEQQVHDLKSDNDLLRQEVRGLTETQIENERLHKLLQFKSHLEYHTIGARVIGREATNWWKSLQIDRGSLDGIQTDQTVLNADGLIGRIASVSPSQSRVLLLCDPTSKASAFFQESREPVVVSGVETLLGNNPSLVMTFVDRTAKVRSGDAVITSGLGGIFPKGILIGTVVKAQLNQQTGMYQDVEIKPAVDYWRLEEVIVILKMTALLITMALFTAAALQARLPSLVGLRLEFLPAVVVYGALTLPWGGAVTLALCAGFIQDSLSVAHPFGATAFIYAAVALVLDRVREDLDRDLPPVHMVGGALTATAASVAACCSVGISVGGVFKILLLGILSAIITPIVFAILDHLRFKWRARLS